MLQAGAALLTAVSLPSCNGIFEGIYDKPSVIDEFGFTKVEQATSSGTIYLDATSYTRWNYIDFETFTLRRTVPRQERWLKAGISPYTATMSRPTTAGS